MQKNITPRLIPALLAIAFSGVAGASGFQLFGEQSASGIGNAGAGSAAVAENAGTIFYNPAGMTKLQAHEFSLGGTLVTTSFDFENGGSQVGAFNSAGDGGNGGGTSLVPNAYLSWQVANDWYLGLGVGAPFGLKTEYNTPWTGSAHSNSFSIKTMNLNPSVAWRTNDWLSLGLGVNFSKMDAEYNKATAIGPIPLGRLPNGTVITAPGNLSQTTLKADDTAWSWNAGALFTVAPKTKIGVSYRSTTEYTLEGSLGDEKGLSTSGPSATLNRLTSSDASAKIKLPDTFIMSLSQGIGEQWELLADVSWTGWSSIPKVDIVRTSSTPAYQSGTTALTLDTQFQDTWRFALGANYQMSEAIKLRAGIAYDQTPIKDAQHRLTSLPDNDRTWLSAGVQWKPTRTSALDVGAAYLFIKDAPIDNFPNAAQGLVRGTYSDYAWLLGAQYSMGF
jgi:long-chain fatty acid transport protein